MSEEMIEKVARAIVVARGGDPDRCLSGYSWEAGEMGRAEAGPVCHLRVWQDRIPEAKAAIAAYNPNERLREALDLFVRAAYPVSSEINPRGHNWSEAYLDSALENARSPQGEDT